MNTTFVKTLKKITSLIKGDPRTIGVVKIQYDTAAAHLQTEHYDIEKYLTDYNTNDAKILKQFAIHTWNLITKEKTTIDKYFDFLIKVNLKDLSKYEQEDYEEECSLVEAILQEIDSVRGLCLEHLIGLYPDEYNDDKTVDEVKKTIHWSSEIKAQFLGQLSLAQKGKPKKERSIHIKDYEEMFTKPEYASPAFEAMKQIKPQLVDNKNHKCKIKNNGYFALWLEIFEDKDIIKEGLNRSDIAEIMSVKIKGLNNERTIYSRTNYAYNEDTNSNEAKTKIKNQIISKFTQLLSCADVQPKN